MGKRKYNAKRSAYDKKAEHYQPRLFLSRFLLPSVVDLRPQCSPVFDQGDIGSCTGNALAGALEFLELADLTSDAAAPEVFDPKSFDSLSRLFIYYNERLLEGDVSTDGGATLANGIKAIGHWGICQETTWPYVEANVLLAPPTPAYQEAKSHSGISGYLIDNSKLAAMKTCLASGNPFVFGVTIYSSFESDAVAQTGMVPMPDVSSEEALGGHALLCVGYDDSRQAFIFRNSWGSDWGLKGYAYIPYQYLTDTEIAWDMWTIRK
jgi:C1A family cysteine protease